jgi:hypothetical protein
MFTCTVVTTYHLIATAILQLVLSLFVFTYVRQDNVKVETPGTCCTLARPSQ